MAARVVHKMLIGTFRQGQASCPTAFFPVFLGRLLGAALLLLLAAGPLAAEIAPEVAAIRLPDGSDMRFLAVHLGIDGTRLFASRRIRLGSREPNPSFKERLVETLLSGSFVGSRKGQPDWLYYLGETEVRQSQWSSVMRWLDEQEGKSVQAGESAAEGQGSLPRTGATVAEVYRFVEALNAWMLQSQGSLLPKFGNARAFCRLPTEAEWEFAARGGIEVLEQDPDRFDRPHPYGEDLGRHEWHRGNSGSKVQDCASPHMQPNPIGLRDMLGNVEELTISLFGPEYQQGRFGQMAVRGCNFSVSPNDFAASRRAELSSHDQSGKVLRPAKVGFRLVLSTSVSGSGATASELDGEFEKYLTSQPLTRPGLVGKSSPAEQAREDDGQYLREQLERIKADKDQLAAEVVRLRGMRDEEQLKRSESERTVQELRQSEQHMKAKIAELQRRLAAGPSPEELQSLQVRLEEAGRKKEEMQRREEKAQSAARLVDSNLQKEHERRMREIEELKQQVAAAPDPGKLLAAERKAAQLEQENESLAARLAELEAAEQQARQKVLESEGLLRERSRELERKEQEVADLGRRQQLFEHEVSKNSGRVRAVEKRYLEALMRQASANAYIGWRILRKREAYLQGTGRSASDEKAQEALSEASQMISDYCSLIVQMAEETQADLFPQVKQELAEWLRAREGKNDPGLQRKALDLIGRHVEAARAGRPPRKEDLSASFLGQPEFR